MLKMMMENVRTMTPLVHNITNYVTVNDCANILLACGSSPIMSDDISEAEEIVTVCNSLVINIGTLNKRILKTMLSAGRKANQLGRPIVFDPVGIGASSLRMSSARLLLKELNFSVIRGNISEIKMVYRTVQEMLKQTSIQTKIVNDIRIDERRAEDWKKAEATENRGVDASVGDCVTEATIDSTVSFAMLLSRMTKAVIVITGAIDIVADAESAYIVRNGHPMMSKITGCGCMLTAVLGAYIAANPMRLTCACTAAVCAMGLCGELAHDKVKDTGEGTGSFRTYLIDNMSQLDGDRLEQGAKLYKLY